MVKRLLLILTLFLSVYKTFSGSVNEIIYQNNLDLYYTINKQKQVDEEIKHRLKIIHSHALQESSMNELAFNKKEKAIGLLQIRKPMVDEINQNTDFKLTHKDCWNKEISIKAFIAFQNEFNPEWDLELAARKWNGGRTGEKKRSTVKYYQEVKQKYNEL